MTLEGYAGVRVAGLIGRVECELGRLSQSRDAEAIHDLRVSVRRLTQALRALRGVLPKKPARAVRRELKPLMDLAGEVRTRDIALELFESAGVAADSAVCVRLALEREDAIAALAAMAGRMNGEECGSRWRRDLEIGR